MHRVLVLNDTVGSKNFGCQLVSNSIRKVIGKFYPESKIDYIGFQKNTPNPPAEDPDVVIVNGEGSYGHHTQIPAGFNNLYKITSYYFEKGIPVHLVNVSIQIPLEILKDVEGYLSKFTTIGLREPISYLFLLKNTKLKNIRLYPDLGTAYFKEESNVKDIDFCVGFGSISKEFNSIKSQTDKYFRVISNLSSEGYSIKYLGFPGNPFSDGELANRYLTNIEIEEDSFESYYHSVKRAKINLTGRHHGAVMSFVGKTPFMSFNSNMWKTEGDQLLYGPFDYFRFEDLNEEQLTLYCKDSINKYKPQRALLDERYKDLQPLFEGHIVSTLGEFTDAVDRGIVNIDEVERTVSTLEYLNVERYGLLGKV